MACQFNRCMKRCLIAIVFPLYVDYVDEVFPGKSLWPTDPYHKALGKLLLNDFGSEVGMCANIIPHITYYYTDVTVEGVVAF